MLRKMSAILTAAVLASSTLLAQSQAPASNPTSLTGTWVGTIWPMKDGQVVDDDPVCFVLKQEGNVVSGTAGPAPERQFPITKVKLGKEKDVTTLGFEVDANGLVIWFDLKLENGMLKGMGSAKREGGEPQTAKVELKLSK